MIEPSSDLAGVELRQKADEMLQRLVVGAQHALVTEDPLIRAEVLATVIQPYAAWATRWVIADARRVGISWPAIAQAVGQQHSTVLRQYQQGGPVVTARPLGVRHDYQDALRRAATKVAQEMFPTRILQQSVTGTQLYIPVQAMADRMLANDAVALLAAVGAVVATAESLIRDHGYPEAVEFEQERAVWVALEKLISVYKRDRPIIEMAASPV